MDETTWPEDSEVKRLKDQLAEADDGGIYPARAVADLTKVREERDEAVANGLRLAEENERVQKLLLAEQGKQASNKAEVERLLDGMYEWRDTADKYKTEVERLRAVGRDMLTELHGRHRGPLSPTYGSCKRGVCVHYRQALEGSE